MHLRFYWTLAFLLALSITFIADRSFSQQNVSAQIKERWQMQSKKAETAGLAEAFRGITTNGAVQPGLFKIKSSGVSTAPVKKAAPVLVVCWLRIPSRRLTGPTSSPLE